MGEVYLAINPGTGGIGKVVALKKISPEHTSDSKRKKLFRHEAEVAIKLYHNNITSVYEVGEHEGSLYLVMEYVPGIDLKDIFRRRVEGLIQLDIADVLNIGIALASALSYAHRFVDPITQKTSPVVHCDICPQNILVSFDGVVKIIDFGVAKVVGQEGQTHSDTVLGKVEYVSPERAQNTQLDGRSDIYSVGIVLWELLAGERYYQGDGFNAIRAHLLGEAGTKQLPDHVPMAKQIQPFMDKMIAADPEDRYASAEELEADLRRFTNKTFPEYIPSKFREALQLSFAHEIIEHKKLIAQYTSIFAQDGIKTEELIPKTPAISANAQNMALRRVTTPPIHAAPTAAKKSVDVDHKGQRWVPQVVEKKTNRALPIAIAVIVMVLIGVFSPLGKKFYDDMNDTQPVIIENPVDAAAPPEEKQVRVLIDSIPQGAQIFLDGKNLYRRTPSYVNLDRAKSYRIQLDKDGFEDHYELYKSTYGPLKVVLNKRTVRQPAHSSETGKKARSSTKNKSTSRTKVRKRPKARSR